MLLLVSSLMTPAFSSPPTRAWGGRFDEFPFQTHHEAFGTISKVFQAPIHQGCSEQKQSLHSWGVNGRGGGFGYHNQIPLFFLAAHFFSSSY